MNNKKVMGMLLIFIVTVGVIGAGAFYFIQNTSSTAEADDAEVLSADEMAANSWELEELTTNLADDHFIKASFKIQLDSEKGREELEKRDYQVKNAIIMDLSSRSAESLQTTEGLKEMEKALQETINKEMTKGKVVKVYITQRLIQ
ncbi:flagellar FliL protein [Sinobaca qinghaiensis]|uniref:Flagellar protein FliL n=1 Tax=Sinobaca qinghaiensis TaxID=342944 RepID=A0A419V5V3_9BACL|nr:flagellar basal body-associated protein FliL [Sinobaca qinghaiensis]RKD75363.1 flagellar FliL protein [Sinobaca qinghaiensis]